jgi:hypothetical protein
MPRWFDTVGSELGLDLSQFRPQQAPADVQAPVQTPESSYGTQGGAQPQTQVPVQPQAPAQVGHNGVTQGGLSREQYRDMWQGSGASSMADLQNFIAQNGGELLDGAGRVRTPYGEVIDMGIAARGSAAGTHEFKPGWGATGADAVAVDQAARAAAGGGGDLFGGGASQGGGMSLGAAMQRPTWTGGDFVADKFTYDKTFQAPTAADMEADPGYAFRKAEGEKALQRSAAAKGSLLGGGTLKALADYGQGLASQEYGNVYGRRLGEFNQDFGRALTTYGTNEDNRFRAHGANVNAALGYGNLALGNKQADNAYSLGQGNLALGQGQLGLQQDAQSFQQGVMFPWQQQSTLAQMGLQAAGQMGNYGSYYGQNAANGLYGQGNAQAAGAVGSGNAWNAGLTGAGNAALDAYAQYQTGRKPKPQTSSYPGVPVPGYGGG